LIGVIYQLTLLKLFFVDIGQSYLSTYISYLSTYIS